MKIKRIKEAFILILCILHLTSSGQDNSWKLKCEETDFINTDPCIATVDYCMKLAQASDIINYTTFGNSAKGKEIPLLIIDIDGRTNPEQVAASGKNIILIMACIHPGEPDGKDAGLMLVRDIAILKKNIELLQNNTLLYIPVFNMDGLERFGPYNRINQNGPAEMGWRTTAQNLNLNRDFLKADAPEMQAFLLLFNKWNPHFFIDCHTTDGADYQYALTYDLNLYGGMDPGLTSWLQSGYLPVVDSAMRSHGFPIAPYVSFRNWHDPRSGLESWVANPMLSEGYGAVQNCPSLLIETHMLKPYKTRVDATYQMILQTIKYLSLNAEELHNRINLANMFCADGSILQEPFPVDYSTTEDSTIFDFEGVEYKVIKSDLTGGDWFVYDTTKAMFSIPFFNKQEPSRVVKLPQYYIVPAEYKEVIERLRWHGIEFTITEHDSIFSVETYFFTSSEFASRPYEGRQRVSTEHTELVEMREFSKGSALIPMQQKRARLIAHLLEPDAPSSLLSWGFFNAIFEQKEYAESYVIEDLARKMINESPELNIEFQNKCRNDKEFASNPRAICNWFYSKTPYWDKNLNKYPIGRILKED